jgi:hypothetical protein
VKIDPRSLIAPLVGVLVLVLVVQSTLAALKASGAWQAPSKRSAIRSTSDRDPHRSP